MKERTILAISGMLCLTAIAISMMYFKVDGMLLSTIVVVIAGLSGYVFGRMRK